MSRLDGEVALVTGAARGLGAAIARVLAAEGASTAIADIDVAGAERTAAELGAPSVAVHIDVSDPGSVQRTADAVAQTLGTVSVLVNNAGVNRTGPSEDLPAQWWASVLDVNLTGSFQCAQIVGRGMLAAGRGAIVNLASSNAAVGSPGRAAYCASKSGVVGLTRALAAEWTGRGVRVNAVAPGYVQTPLLQSCFDEGIIAPDYLLGRIPAGRLGTAEHVATAVAFLASSDADYISGQTIPVDGGYLAYGGPQPASEGITRAVNQAATGP